MRQSGAGRDRNRRDSATIAVLGLALALSAPGPLSAADEETVVSPAVELALTLQVRESFLETNTVVEDPLLATEVVQVGRTVVAQSERPELPFAFYVVEPDPNGDLYQAVSAAGGTVGLTRPLVELLIPLPDELAFALAHEIAHVSLRHHLAGFGLVEPAPREQRYADRLRRHVELEADRYAALYLVRAGFRFTAAVEALQRIADASGGRDRAAANHPTFAERIAALEGFREELERSVAAFDRGVEFLETGDAESALQAFALFVQQFPESRNGRINFATACLLRLRKASGGPGGLAEPLPYLTASGITIRGVYDGELLARARHGFARALAIDPQSREARIGLAVVETREGGFAAAQSYLDGVLGGERDASVHLARGNAWFLAGYPEAAIAEFERAGELEAGWPAAARNLALTYELLGSDAEAAAVWRELLDRSPNHGEARVHLSMLEDDLLERPFP